MHSSVILVFLIIMWTRFKSLAWWRSGFSKLDLW